jgi:pimeloyl-ACP methyl ester carboxylesterase
MNLRLRDGASMAWRLDDFTDPWKPSPTVLFVHGNSESGKAWDRWVGTFAADFRILRPDLRGFGDSQPMPQAHPWSLDEIADDLTQLLDHLQLATVHVVGAKIGGMVALHLAATCPERVASLCVIGSPVSGAELTRGATPDEEIREGGVGAWARRTMAARLGPRMPAAAHTWWSDYMGRTATSTQLGFLRDLPGFDVRGELGRIACPTLVVATQEDTPVGNPGTVRAWQERLANSRLQVVPASGYHVALTEAHILAPLVADFAKSCIEK